MVADTVENAIVTREGARVARCCALAGLPDAALHEHQRLAPGESARGAMEGASVSDALDVDQGDVRVRVDGEVVEQIRKGRLRRVAQRDRLADAHSRGHGIVEVRRDEVAALARYADASCRRVRRDDLGAHRVLRGDHALPVRADQEHPELVRDLRKLPLQCGPVPARFGIPGARHEGGANALFRAIPQQADVRVVRRAHEDQIRLVLGDRLDGRVGLASEHLGAVGLDGEEASLVAKAKEVVKRHEAELAGMARHTGDHDSARVEERAEAFQDLFAG